MSKVRVCLLTLALAAGCAGRPAEAPAGTGERAYAAERASEGGACTSDADCCDSTFCQTYAVYSPAWHTCVAKRADGGYCQTAHECVSGVCESSHCGAACAAAGADCTADADCCAGNFCNNHGYAGTDTCMPHKADGARCYADAECTSSHCDLSQLKCTTPAPACGDVGASCQTQTDCCSGSYCDVFTYLGRKCRAAGAVGASCYTNEMCASGDCDLMQYACR